jgi:hypothetical protein
MVADTEDFDRRSLSRSTVEVMIDTMIVNRERRERGCHETSRQAV